MVDLLEFKRSVLEDVEVSANIDMNDVSNEFIKYVVDCLVDIEEIDDFTDCYFEAIGKRNKIIQIDGYNFDDADNSLMILICNYVNNPNEIDTITNTTIEKLYSRMSALVENSINGYIKDNCEESSPGYGLALNIEEKFSEISKIRFYIITDQAISNKVKFIKRKPISEIPVELNVWDISRLFDVAKSNMAKESIEIDLLKKTEDGLPCILAMDNGKENYKSYLTVIRGDILADLYLDYGARLLEGNVRSFLSTKGKINKGIKRTIENEPEMFFAYNNGIAATAFAADVVNNDKGSFITRIVDLQIINGGQTTASIANAVLQSKTDVSNISVPMKLSIVDKEKSLVMVPLIAEYANSQNKVDAADFASNHPFHIRIEEYSRKVYAPAVDGNQYQTIWFYERARGQYTQAQMKLTASDRKKFSVKHPKSQVIKKVDIAKYVNTERMLPHTVSKGSQFNAKEFYDYIKKEWDKSNEQFNEYYYKKIIALAIMFKQTESIVSDQDWYKAIKAYRANIVTYTLAVIFNYIVTEMSDYSIDYKKIWNTQKLYSQLIKQIEVTSKEVYEYITSDDRPTLNVTEWCKREACWNHAKRENWTMNENFLKTLISRKLVKEEENDAKKNRKLTNEVSLEILVVQKGDDYWNKVLKWGTDRKLLNPIETDLLFLAAKSEKTGKVPTYKQANVILKTLGKLKEEGFYEET